MSPSLLPYIDDSNPSPNEQNFETFSSSSFHPNISALQLICPGIYGADQSSGGAMVGRCVLTIGRLALCTSDQRRCFPTFDRAFFICLEEEYDENEPHQRRTRVANLTLRLSPPLLEWMLLRSFSSHASLSKICARTRPLERHAYGGGRSSCPGMRERQRQNHHPRGLGILSRVFRSRPQALAADCDTTRWFSLYWRVSDSVDQSRVAPDESPFLGHCSTTFGNALSSLSEVHNCSPSPQDQPH